MVAQGALRVKAAVEEIRAEELGNPQYLGVVWNKVTPNRTSTEFLMDEVRALGVLPIFDTQIPHRQAAVDAELLGLPAATDPGSDLGAAFADLAAELSVRTGISAAGEGPGMAWRERQEAKKAERARPKKDGKAKKGKKNKKGAA